MLTRDLNAVIAQGNNWSLPMFWAPVMRWITAPVLAVILAIGYQDYTVGKEYHKDPLHVFSFILSHVGVAFIIVGFFWPNTFAWWSPRKELESDQRQYLTGPGVTLVREPGSPARSGAIEVGDEIAGGEHALPHIA